MERIEMSQEERDKLEWLKRAKDGVITQREAARKIGVSDRWVRKLLKRMKKRGDAVVVHGLRGRASNRKIASADTETGHRASEAGRVARLRTDLCQRAVSQTASASRSAKRLCADG